MSKNLAELFSFQSLGEYQFRANNQPLGRRVYGGQVVAQALAAACQTCREWACHSLHGYFLRVGDIDVPIDYTVEVLHDGRSFSNRRVVASQQGKTIFHLSVSFHAEENGLEFQTLMPEVPCPEQLQVLSDLPVQQGRQRSTEEMRVEIRPVLQDRLVQKDSTLAKKYWWIRLIDPLPETLQIHQCALAYATDFGLFGTARETHGIGFREPGYLLASIDHAIWFHREFRCENWMLYAMDCPTTSAGRGFGRGQIFTRDGMLIASTAQEGLIRLL